jgi:integrase/recombinase XerC
MGKVEVLTAVQERELISAVDPIGDRKFRQQWDLSEPIKNATEWKCARNAVIVLMMSEAGLRVGEVVQLVYSDCYYACKPVSKLRVRMEIAKGGQVREVPLTRRLRFVLERYWWGEVKDEVNPDYDFMITRSKFGQRMTTRGIEKFIEKVGRLCLGIKLYPHMLRHTCATKLMRITDMPTVQRILGHKHLSSTEIYTHPNSEDIDLAIKSMEEGCRQPGPASGG